MKYHYCLNLLAFAAALAATLSSCSRPEDIPARQTDHNLACYSSVVSCRAGVSSSSAGTVRTLDIFIYDTSGSLDSYQQITPPEGILPERIELSSTAGYKTAVFIANLPDRSFSYMDIISYDGLLGLRSSLYDEDMEHPVMSGTCRFTAGPGKVTEMELVPVSARVRIRSFAVDFSSRPYHDMELTDIRSYLINVNASCMIAVPDRSPRGDFINFGRLDETAASTMRQPEMVFGSGPPAGSSFFCYPFAEGDSTQACTKLVIEGKIGGNVYYYPVLVGGGCVKAGIDYIFDVFISRSGGLSPEDVLEEGTLRITSKAEPWKEYEWEDIEY